MTARRAWLLRFVAAILAAGAVALGVRLLIGSRATLTVGPYELLAPGWLYLVAVLPYFWLVRSASLTDLAPAQQALSTVLRTVLVVAYNRRVTV